jgi:hypothetical protein
MKCANCHHHEHDHANNRAGTACTVRYGALGDNNFLDIYTHGELCWCTGWRPAQ